MAKANGFQLWDYIDFAVKRKELFVTVFFASLLLSYTAIFFLVDDQFEATATIIPRQDESSSLASSVIRGMKGVPLNIGGTAPSDQIDLYKTIVYSRTMMENVIRQFGLIARFRLDTTDPACMEKAVKRLSEDVQTKETEESAFVVAVRANSRQLSANMTNYVVHALNDRIIDLQVSRSRDNRIFLENRVQEISKEIRDAEDSLKVYQEKTGMLDIKSQLEGILKTHATLETEFAGKQLQLSIMQQMFNGDAPQVKELEIQVDAYEKKLRQLRSEGDPGSPLLPLKAIPTISVGFLNRYREVEIDNLLLEYLMPLYEQAKIDEKKDYPVLQVVDYAVPPAKKSFPPRGLLSLIGAFSVSILLLVILIARESLRNGSSSRVLLLAGNLRHWNWRIRKSL